MGFISTCSRRPQPSPTTGKDVLTCLLQLPFSLLHCRTSRCTMYIVHVLTCLPPPPIVIVCLLPLPLLQCVRGRTSHKYNTRILTCHKYVQYWTHSHLFKNIAKISKILILRLKLRKCGKQQQQVETFSPFQKFTGCFF